MISLATTTITEEVKKNVAECLDTGRIGGGRFVKEFEDRVASLIGVKHAIAVNNGTMADMVAVAAAKAKRPEKTEVIVPAYTFVAQTNSVVINGLTPIFVDCDKNFQIDIKKVKVAVNENTLAIFGVHLFGANGNMEELKKIADENDVFLIEDTCEAFAGEVSGKKFGTIGDMGTFSFFPSHTISTGEGGMIITNDDEFASLCRKISNHSRRSDSILEKFHFDYVGFNGKMSNVLAAIGCGVVGLTDEVIEKRRANVRLYNALLNKYWFASSPHCYPVLFNTREERDAMLVKLEENGIEGRKLFSSLPTQENVYKAYGFKMGDFPNAEDFGNRGLFVPVHQGLTEEDIKKVCSVIA